MTIKKNIIIFFYLSGIFLLFFLYETNQCFCQTDEWMKVLTPLQGASLSYEYVHFVVQTLDSGMVDINLKVSRNDLFLKEVNPKPGHYYSGRYYFHFAVRLDFGSNKINLCFVNKIGEFLDETNINLSYGDVPNVSKIMNVGNSPIIWYSAPQETSSLKRYGYKFHTFEQESACLKCHDLSISESAEINPEKISCRQCHEEKYQDKILHQVMKNSFNCLQCHSPDQKSGYGFKQIDSGRCISCHEENAFIGRKYIHAPLACGECWICHEPHKGKTKYRLEKKVNKLCTSCHTGKHYGKVEVNNHPILYNLDTSRFAGREYQCTDCHDPHSSNANKFLLLSDTKGPNEPCKRCHSQYF